jgi:hypothetical protein
MAVINSVTILFFMPVLGINQGLQPILGYNYGAGSFSRVREAWRFGVLVASAIVTCGFLAVQLFPQTIIRIFIDDAGLVTVGTRGLRIFLAMLPLLGFQVISTVYFQSVGKPRVAIVASLLRQVIILLPLYLVLPNRLGLTGVWLASPIADFTSFAITGVLILREMAQLKKKASGFRPERTIREQNIALVVQPAAVDLQKAGRDASSSNPSRRARAIERTLSGRMSASIRCRRSPGTCCGSRPGRLPLPGRARPGPGRGARPGKRTSGCRR